MILNRKDNMKSQKIEKKSEWKAVIHWSSKEPLTYRMKNYEDFIPYKFSDKRKLR